MIRRVQSYAQNPVFWGAFLSLLLIGAVLYWASWAKTVSFSAPRTNFEVFLASRPNEVGDLLAGVAGALAFIWIIVTVWLQSKELAAQREELRLTRGEMEEQRKATQEMALAMSAQTHVFQDELKQREQLRAEELLGHKLDRCKVVANWLFIGAKNLKNEEISEIGEIALACENDTEWQLYINVRNVMISVLRLGFEELRELRRDHAEDLSNLVGWVEEINALLSDISEMQYELSAGQVQRLYNFEFDELFDLTGCASSHLFNPDIFEELSGAATE